MIRSSSKRWRSTYGRGEGRCALGAVKTNIGHLEAAAGIAGFIKATLAVQRGQIPPNLHFSQWNPAIDPSHTRLFVPTDLTPWPAGDDPRRAAVSSFGLGGTNAHVVIEQGPDPAQAEGAGSAITTLVISAKTDERIASWAAVLADWAEGSGAAVPLADVAHTLNHHRPPPCQVRHGVRRRSHAGGGRVAFAGRGSAGAGSRGTASRRAWIRHGVPVFRSGFTVGRHGSGVAGRRSRRSRRRWPSWSRFSLSRWGFRCGTCWPRVNWCGVSSASSRCWWGCSWR